MYIDEVQLFIDEFKQNSSKSINHLRAEFATIRAGRANPRILDKVMVNYYGSPTPLNQVANITIPEARVIALNVWDIGARNEVIRAINASDIGITPNDDGKTIRLIFPVLTEDRRKELCKEIKKMGEETKITLRNERRDCLDAVKKLKNEKLVTEDELIAIEKDVQKLIDGYASEVDNTVSNKEKEILSV